MAPEDHRPVIQRKRWWAVALIAAVSLVVPSFATAASATLQTGDSVWVSSVTQGYTGTNIHGVFLDAPVDPNNPGTPDYWAYCIENRIEAGSRHPGIIGDPEDYLGSNLYATDPTVPNKVTWVLAHSYPYLSLDELRAASGVPTLSINDAVEATQYAVWRYTDVGWDAPWDWETPDSEAVYWYLVNGANTSGGQPIGEPITVSIDPSDGAFPGGDLAGPYTVSTNQSSVSLTASNGLAFVDGAGAPIDASAVVDGQQVFLDLRNVTSAGSATITATATGASGTGKIITVPSTPGGTATPEDHAQSMVLAVPSDATTNATATVNWTVPSIGTSLVDAADGDQIVAWNGGTVTDTVAYENLIPGLQYTVAGELMRKSDGSSTGITGSRVFTPGEANGQVTVEFTIPEGYAGETLVAFERLYEGDDTTGTPVATHEDIEDLAQTVVVENAPVPSIGTSLVDAADGDQIVAWNGGTVTDTVAYQNLTPGQEYTLTGELMRKSDGTATGITGSTTFTPSEANGEVDVTFTIPEGYAGETLVAFEWLYAGGEATGTPVASHTDIDDAAQTVTVEKQPATTVTTPPASGPKGGSLATTGSSTPPMLVSGIALLGLIAGGGALLLARRRAVAAETQ
ncbi:VaFE repeat-containing surface-anchored protein [Leucobacter allii]|uniref:VaFE repeat-containing surface-anchored protein n=1 Tax=Leucobacter allii TaxID=2932247 RepID=UPI001FD278F0|nr:VaFE repeat-containing surface-anchored protein [Leucobacter allii]UOR01785.1 VaFE repeat-containing surface-anchored protein [Leucobacter allii]